MAKAKLSVLNHLKLLALQCKADHTAKIAELATAVSDAVSDLNDQKADKAREVTISIPISAWKSNAETATLAAGFAMYADVTVSGLATDDSVDTVLDYASLSIAKACGLSNTASIKANGIRYYAVAKPSAALSAVLSVRN